MLAVVALCGAMTLARPHGDACPGLDQTGASLSERRVALVECARVAGKPALDYFLEHLATLNTRDPRLSSYGEVAESWPADELTAQGERLLAIAKGEGGASAASRIVVIRALLALPAQRRPAGTNAFEPHTVDLSAVPSRMTYDKKEITATSGSVVRVRFHNADALEHNMLIVAPGALAEMGLAGDRMGQVPEGKLKEFIPDSPKVLAVMGIVAPGASRDFWFIAPTSPGTYPYVCTYPQHWRMMNGKLKVTAPTTPEPDAPPPASVP